MSNGSLSTSELSTVLCIFGISMLLWYLSVGMLITIMLLNYGNIIQIIPFSDHQARYMESKYHIMCKEFSHAHTHLL